EGQHFAGPECKMHIVARCEVGYRWLLSDPDLPVFWFGTSTCRLRHGPAQPSALRLRNTRFRRRASQGGERKTRFIQYRRGEADVIIEVDDRVTLLACPLDLAGHVGVEGCVEEVQGVRSRNACQRRHV